MKPKFKTVLTALLLAVSLPSMAATHVLMETDMGNIRLVLDESKAPKTVANFVRYARKGFYDNTIFHRVIDGFVIQGGGFTEDLVQKASDKAVANESGNGLKPSPWRGRPIRIPPPANSLSIWRTMIHSTTKTDNTAIPFSAGSKAA